MINRELVLWGGIMAFRESSDGFFWNQGFERRSVGTLVKPTAVGPLGPTGRGLKRGRARTRPGNGGARKPAYDQTL
jgi:hypothetical protein